MALHPLRDFETVIINPDVTYPYDDVLRQSIGYIDTTYRNFKQSRQAIEDIWLYCWASYLSTEQGFEYLRQRTQKVIGNVNDEWRHKLKLGKAAEIVETIHSYMMSSFFPNKNWLSIESKDASRDNLAKVLTYYITNKLDEWGLELAQDSFLRQLIICGTSVMALPWSDEQIKYECLDVFDCYFNPELEGIEDSPFIRKVQKTRADLISGITSGRYNKNANILDIIQLDPMASEITYDTHSPTYKSFRGTDVAQYSYSDKITTIEFWGDIQLPHITIKNVLMHIVGGVVLRFEPNTYKCGKPFIVGTYIPVVRQSHGIGALQHNMSMLRTLDTTASLMADGAEIAVQPMYTYVPSLTTSPENLTTEPGKIIPVEDHNAIRPLPAPQNNFGLSFQQLSYFESMINQNAGTGPLVGAGQPRGGERVTAAEIQAVTEAGGARQLGIYSHIRRQSFVPLLRKTTINVRQFTRIEDVVRVDDTQTRQSFLIDVGPQELDFEFDIIPRGSEHVIQKAEHASRLQSILELALNLPEEVQGRIDITQIFLDIVEATLYEDPGKYLVPLPEEQEQAPTDIAAEGSPVQQQFIQEQMLADGGQNLLSQLIPGGSPDELSPNSITSPTTNPTGAEQLLST